MSFASDHRGRPHDLLAARASDPEIPDVPPPHRPLPPGEVPTPILPDPGEPGPIVPDPLPEREPQAGSVG